MEDNNVPPELDNNTDQAFQTRCVNMSNDAQEGHYWSWVRAPKSIPSNYRECMTCGRLDASEWIEARGTQSLKEDNVNTKVKDIEDVTPGDRIVVKLEGIVLDTYGPQIYFLNGSSVYIDDEVVIEKLRPPLPTTIGTILRTIYTPVPYIVKFRDDEWKTFGGNSYTNAEVDLRWNEGEYEVFQQYE